MTGRKEEKKKGISSSFVLGAVALVFLIIGYQAALFINRAAVSKVLAEEEQIPHQARNESAAHHSDESQNLPKEVRDDSQKPVSDKEVRDLEKSKDIVVSRPAKGFASPHKTKASKKVENFNFDPNTISISDLQRLGFSEKQAASIDRYRQSGGIFRRKSDFAKSFVVADSVYKRLEPYIDIPLLDLNIADTTALDALPGIGSYFARKIVEYRDRLQGYSYKEQLMDIYNFDAEKYSKLEELIKVSEPKAYQLWTLPEDSLSLHPYIGRHSAHGIIIYRNNNPTELWTVENLAEAGILPEEKAEKLSRCHIAPPENSTP